MKYSSFFLSFLVAFLSSFSAAAPDPQNTSNIPPHSSPFDSTVAGPTNEPNPTDSRYSLPTSSGTTTILTGSSAVSSASSAVASASASISSVQSSISSAISSETSAIASGISSINSQVSASVSSAASASASSSTATGNVGVMQKPMPLATAGAVLGGAMVGVAVLF